MTKLDNNRKTLWEVAVLHHYDEETVLLGSPFYIVAKTKEEAGEEVLKNFEHSHFYENISRNKLELLIRSFASQSIQASDIEENKELTVTNNDEKQG